MSHPTEPNATILVVDDNEDNRLIAGTNLEMAGYRVEAAENGERALALLAQGPVDLVLLDIMMPGLDGYEVCRLIRADKALHAIKVLMLTAKAATSDLVKGFEAGADDYVTKPFEVEELLTRVRNLVGLKQAETELRRLNADLEGEVERRAQELARSEARYRTIVNAVPASIMLLDAEGRITAVNAWHQEHPLFTALYEPPLAAALLAEHPGAVAMGIAHYVRRLLDGTGFEHEAHPETAHPGYGSAVVRVRGVPIPGGDGGVQGALVLHEDRTEERRLQTRMLEGQKLASIGTLAQGVAHNFNNLLFVVSGSLEILRASIGPSHERPFEQARTALSRMAALTRQLAAFSRLGEEGCQPVRITQLLREVGDSFIGKMPDGVRLRIDAPDDSLLVNGCPGELFRAYQGLMQNALEAMPEGGEVRVTICTERRLLPDFDGKNMVERVGVVCEVADAGIGMDEEAQRRAFEPFYTSKQTVGVGLGLWAAHGIVRSHGGTIEVTSTLRVGTRVTVTLPACENTQPARPAPTAQVATHS